jgi:hypothetical protein
MKDAVLLSTHSMMAQFAAIIIAFVSGSGAFGAGFTTTNQPHAAPVSNERAAASPQKLPPLPRGVTELKFSDFFVRPVGPRGLELTDKLESLDGKRVRILGYMVQQEHPPKGQFILSPLPAQIHHHDNHLADDLPPGLVYVSVPTSKDKPIPYARGLMLLTGTLSVGQRIEADERISLVRLDLDPPGKKSRKPNNK